MSRYTSSSYRTALVAASFRGDCEGVQSLLDIELPDDVTQAMKRTFCNVSLLKAAHGNHADVVRILLAAGAAVSSPNSQGNTALHIAAEQGHMRVSTVVRQARMLSTARIASRALSAARQMLRFFESAHRSSPSPLAADRVQFRPRVAKPRGWCAVNELINFTSR